MSDLVYAAAIDHNTIHDHDAPVSELQSMARFGAHDDLYVAPVSGDALAKVRKLGTVWATACLLGWSAQP